MLSTAQDQLVAVLDAVGLSGRKVIEEGEADPIVFLLEEAGAGFGYQFEWERYGPFSEALASDLVELSAEDFEYPRALDGRLKEVAQRVRDMIEPSLPGLPCTTWIRLLAAVLFLQRYSGMQLDSGNRPPYLQAPPFEQSMIEAAVARVANLQAG
jgi:hypothetical protein